MTPASPRARRTLEAIEEGRSQVARLRRAVSYLEAKCTARTSRCTQAGGSSAPGRDDLLVELIDRKTALQTQENQLRQQLEQLERWIDLLPRPRWRMVLRYHYLEGLELPDVAQALTAATGRSFSVSQIYRLHREALASAEGLWPFPVGQVPANAPIGSGMFHGLQAATAPRMDAAGAGSR